MASMLEQMLAPRPEKARVREGKSISTRISVERHETLLEASRLFGQRKSDLVAAVFDYGFEFLEKKLTEKRKQIAAEPSAQAGELDPPQAFQASE